MIDRTFLCPVCGFKMDEPPWDENSGPSLEICPSCGIQFGYEDVAGGDPISQQVLYRTRRKKWIEGGMKWQSVGQSPPHDWNPAEQVYLAFHERTPYKEFKVNADEYEKQYDKLTSYSALNDALHNFFYDRKISAEDTAKKLVTLLPGDMKLSIIGEGEKLLKEKDFPWAALENAANTPIGSEEEGRKWLENILNILEEVSKNSLSNKD